jgi:flagellar hook-associated protein 3 FlgL
MRVSDSMISELVRRGIDESRTKVYENQQASSTGLRVEKPSDDPVAAAAARSDSASMRRSEVVAKTADSSITELQSVDGALAQMVEVLTRTQEIAVAGANDTYTAEERTAMATEVRELRAQLLALSNTKVNGSYVFGGLAAGQPPFDATGTFVGSTTLRQLDIGQGVRVTTQVSGATALGVGTGAETFATLDSLITALEANDATGVFNTLTDVGTAVDNMAQARTSAGAAQSSLEMARAAAERAQDYSNARRAEHVEVDPFDAFSDLVRAENALRRAMALANRMPQTLLEGGP